MLDHGGNMDAAMARFGGGAQDWIDLSTGINRVPYPLPNLPARAWTDLPTRADMARLVAAARDAWGVSGAILPLSGAQQAIQLIPRLGVPGRARVLSPTYNEHAASLRAAGWQVEAVATLADLAGADLAVVVNPNNPDGQHHASARLLELLPQVGQLVVDESFVDPYPQQSLAAKTGLPGLWVLRSFGKFYGLAGLRLGFALGPEADVERLSTLAGPWPVSGAAIEVGCRALGDRVWQVQTATRLAEDAARLDMLCPLLVAGGTMLFRLYDSPDAARVQDHLASHRIWSRIFPWSPRLVRLGLPAPHEWPRVAMALDQMRAVGLALQPG
ncbi:threonine-phosphate decarboxylase CobD [Fuscibacter oryzae]|uniref:threonine-phosphate decarboxylase n=1 Tax=Fuscibacter oryzae TaxID=2803939 RepID=A0A8J7SWJ7_9RHOB|nr:threonine-phosphate decarboxylase CobD [Fuscibacter oryzae]MBL4929004.1 threonine-phosphate decarboxylase [Fuscibacter oryzae]